MSLTFQKMKCPSPNHFLINGPFNSLPPGKFDSHVPDSFRSWKNIQQMVSHFFKRLVKEYLSILLKRYKWSGGDQKPLVVNDTVWVLKDITPSGVWPLGSALEVYPGRNGHHRVVKLKTAYITFAGSPPWHASWLISPFFSLPFFRNGSLGNLGYTLFDDLVKRLCCFVVPLFPWSTLRKNQVRSEP